MLLRRQRLVRGLVRWAGFPGHSSATLSVIEFGLTRTGSLSDGAPHGTERTLTETAIKWAFLRLSAEVVIPPGYPTGKPAFQAFVQHASIAAGTGIAYAFDRLQSLEGQVGREVEEAPQKAMSGLVIKRSMSDLTERMTASAFKVVEGGYLFQPMSGWRLGRSPCYLVNEEQKAMIAARLMKNVKAMPAFQAVYLAACVAVMLILLVAQWEVFPAMMTAIVGTGTVFLIAMQVYARRTIGPLLAGLPVAGERISLNDRLKQQSKVLSSKFLLLIALANILLGVIAAGLELLVVAIVLFGMAAWYLWLVFLRWKAARPHA